MRSGTPVVRTPHRLRRRAALLTMAALLVISLFAAPGGAAEGGLGFVAFTDEAEARGLYDGIPISWYGTFWADVDGDADMDAFINPHNFVAPQLLLNDGTGSFSQAPNTSFPVKDRHGCAWGDVDLDGDLDLYCTIGAEVGTSKKSNELWIQQDDGSFEDEAEAWKVRDTTGRGREAVFFDFNHDPYPDLYLANQAPRVDGRPSHNRLYVNDSGERFVSSSGWGVRKEIGAIRKTRGCIEAVDENGDGWTDLLVCGRRGPHLYRNKEGERFADVTASSGITDGVTWYWMRLVDVNGDARPDLVGVREEGLFVQIRGPRRFKAEERWVVRATRQVQPADVDLDGDIDLYAIQGRVGGSNRPDLIFVNDGTGDFSRAVIENTSMGDGDSVVAVDLIGDARPEFVVTNGLVRAKGPLELLVLP